ncbi:MAG: AEC family transporter [Planctomycetota bacterium]
MNSFLRLLLLLLVEAAPLAAGYALKARGLARESWGRPLSRFIIIFINTSVVLMAAWALQVDWGNVARLLVIGFIFGLSMTAVGKLMSRLHRTDDRADEGAYIIATPISNFGFTMAGFVAFMLYGRAGISQQTVYIYPLVLLIYLFWFPLARSYGSINVRVPVVKSILMALTDWTSLPILGTAAGLGLHAAGWALPEALGTYVLPVFVYGGTMLSMFTIGVTFQPHSVRRYLPQNASIAVSKFLIAPALGLSLAMALHVTGISRAVVLICSSAPVGLFSSFAASIFGLNRNMTNALFIVNTTLYLAVVLPLLFWLLPHFFPAGAVVF